MNDAPATRLRAIDLLRGLACVLMALDHVRVYASVPAGGPEPAIFFTRWITHFVAPAFCFFAGTGAFFHGRSLGDMSALRRFLFTRGLLLVLLELTIIRFTWTFNLDYAHFTLAGVIWMLGWCMVLLAALVSFAPRTLGIAGLALIVLQPFAGVVPSMLPAAIGSAIAPVYSFLYYINGPLGETPPLFGIAILYVIIPWIGVMMCGYAWGAMMSRGEGERDRCSRRWGLWLTGLFLLIGGAGAIMAGGDRPVWFRLLNQNKYPPSVMFLMMTLGPTLLLTPWAARAKGWWSDALVTFGRVPLFYYLLHIPLIHLLAMAVAQTRPGAPVLVGNYPMQPPPMPEGYRWPLWMLYAVWVVAVAVLYPVCRWYAEEKRGNPRGWMRFV